jgi:hypothetical protein
MDLVRERSKFRVDCGKIGGRGVMLLSAPNSLSVTLHRAPSGAMVQMGYSARYSACLDRCKYLVELGGIEPPTSCMPC